MLRSATGLLTLTSIQEAVTYTLQPSVTCIVIDENGNLNNSVITCIAYRNNANSTIDELTNNDCLIKYTVSNTNVEYDYDWSHGVYVNKQWNSLRFKLYVNHVLVRFVDVPVVRNGQIDSKFQIWVGETSSAPSKTQTPWKDWIQSGEENQHVGDYYISTDMTYWVFKFSASKGYYWEEITDATLKRILDRSTTKTSGYIIDGNFEQYFRNTGHVYYTGDIAYYNGEIYIAWKDQTGSPKFSDWKLGSNLKEKFNEAGISIDDKLSINITADTLRFYNTESDDPIFLISEGYDNEGNAYPRINTSLIEFDSNVIIKGDAAIHGWYIEDGIIYHPSSVGYLGVGISSIPNKYAFWAGDNIETIGKDNHGNSTKTYPFSVTQSGYLHSTAGDIGGWYIQNNGLFSEQRYDNLPRYRQDLLPDRIMLTKYTYASDKQIQDKIIIDSTGLLFVTAGYTPNVKIEYGGAGYLAGRNFNWDDKGNITANAMTVLSGAISNWTISQNLLYAGKSNLSGGQLQLRGGDNPQLYMSSNLGSSGITLNTSGFSITNNSVVTNLLRSDGSGYFAKGNISWTADGKVTFGENVELNWGSGSEGGGSSSGSGNYGDSDVLAYLLRITDWTTLIGNSYIKSNQIIANELAAIKGTIGGFNINSTYLTYEQEVANDKIGIALGQPDTSSPEIIVYNNDNLIRIDPYAGIYQCDKVSTSNRAWCLLPDGAGQLANGKISWTAQGDLSITGQINSTDLMIDGESLKDYLDKHTGSSTGSGIYWNE